VFRRKKMDNGNIPIIIRGWLIQSIHFLRIGWSISAIIGIGLIVLAVILKKNPERKISPWIVGILGVLAVVSSCTQLVYSWFLMYSIPRLLLKAVCSCKSEYFRLILTGENGMYKRMLGETIYQLRKKRGMSQSELGTFAGVSNKAVSKWETYEANPDITLLPLLAQALGVTADELLADVKIEKNDQKPKEAKVFGMQGTVIKTSEVYEFISDKKTRKNLPYLHIHFGKKFQTINAKARGVIAIGNNAKGIISIGLFSIGIISMGLISLGLFGLLVLTMGLAIGYFAGGTVIGTIAAGIVSIWVVQIVIVLAVLIGYYVYMATDRYASDKNIIIH
jgi:transcriptional regulator with XRE-family HTH domain